MTGYELELREREVLAVERQAEALDNIKRALEFIEQDLRNKQ